MELKSSFIHHVFFWLKNPESKEDKAALIEGLKKLAKIETIKQFHIGEAAATNRDVIERSYSISWTLVFDSLNDEEIYQPHPIHKKFVEECSHLWNKVVVYDTESIG
ncbi:MAG: Dabb family protein [Bacteroidetes bacterium]|nr:Dabb family protein [Bacteroidota bacterium]